MVGLNAKALQDALIEMLDVQGIPAAEIERAAGVYNVRRLADGVNAPAVPTWVKLHKAYPDHIPPVSYIDGGDIFIKQGGVIKGGGNTVALRDMTINGGLQLTPQEITLITAIREKSPDGKLTMELIVKVMSEK